MGKIRDDRQFDIVFQTDVIAPEPYPQIAFPGWSADLTKGKEKGITKGAKVQVMPEEKK
jgi:hypothetical protein